MYFNLRKHYSKFSTIPTKWQTNWQQVVDEVKKLTELTTTDYLRFGKFWQEKGYFISKKKNYSVC